MSMAMFFREKSKMIDSERALPGRSERMRVPERHYVLGTPLEPPFPDGCESAVFGMRCFWGAERKFWEADGVYTTAVGYAGGYTQNPSYEEVCSGSTGHTEVVLVVFDPAKTSYDEMLKIFWETHDPTQGMRQGNDMGTQYRSSIFVHDDAQRAAAEASRAMYQAELSAAGYGEITTEIVGPPAPTFFFAEDYHQQYLDRNPNGYCPNHATGITLPDGFAVTPLEYAD